MLEEEEEVAEVEKKVRAKVLRICWLRKGEGIGLFECEEGRVPLSFLFLLLAPLPSLLDLQGLLDWRAGSEGFRLMGLVDLGFLETGMYEEFFVRNVLIVFLWAHDELSFAVQSRFIYPGMWEVNDPTRLVLDGHGSVLLSNHWKP